MFMFERIMKGVLPRENISFIDFLQKLNGDVSLNFYRGMKIFWASQSYIQNTGNN